MFNTEHLEFFEDGWGYLPPTQEIYDILNDISERLSPKSMLEIGFYMGHSTSYFAQLMPDCQIVSCCPPHPRGTKYGEVITNLYDNVQVITTPSPDIIQEVNQQFDLVFVDGSHHDRNVIQDTLVSLKYQPEYILYDNGDCAPVKSMIQMFVDCGSIRIDKVYQYESRFKGKHNTHDLVLAKNLLTSS